MLVLFFDTIFLQGLGTKKILEELHDVKILESFWSF